MAACALVLAALLSGCTVINVGLGSVIDSAESDRTRCAVAHVGRGTTLTLHMRDSSRVRGRLQGLLEPDTARYTALHQEWAASASVKDLLPSPGERVVLHNRSRAYAATFHGLSPAGARVQGENQEPARVVPFAGFETLTDARGRSLTSGFLSQLVQDGSVPTGTRVVLEMPDRKSSRLTDFTPGPSDTLAWDDAVRVDAPRDVRFKVLGGVFGLLTDLIIVAMLAYTGTQVTPGW